MKKKTSLRNSKYEYCNIQEFANEQILLNSREMIIYSKISQKTIDMMDSAIENLKNEKVSEPLDLTNF